MADCEHQDLHFLGNNAGVYCRFCGATWRRGRVPHRYFSHLILTEEIQADGVLFAPSTEAQPEEESHG